MTDSSYSAGQSADTLSQGFSTVSENNTEGMSNSGGKLTWENLRFDKSQKALWGWLSSIESQSRKVLG